MSINIHTTEITFWVYKYLSKSEVPKTALKSVSNLIEYCRSLLPKEEDNKTMVGSILLGYGGDIEWTDLFCALVSKREGDDIFVTYAAKP